MNYGDFDVGALAFVAVKNGTWIRRSSNGECSAYVHTYGTYYVPHSTGLDRVHRSVLHLSCVCECVRTYFGIKATLIFSAVPIK